MDMKRARDFAALLIKKRQLNAELDEVKGKMTEMEPLLQTDLINAGIKRLPFTVGGEDITIHLHTTLYARPKDGDKATVVRVLKRCGLSGLVKNDYNMNTLDAWVRERLIANKGKLPPTLESVLDLNEIVSVRGRRSPVSSESQTAKAIKTIRR